MRAAIAIFLIFFTPVAAVSAPEPTKDELLLAIQKQLKSVNETAGTSVVCVVASKNDRYPKPTNPSEHPGQLGRFDLSDFLKTHRNELQLARALDLSDPTTIADHGYACGVIIDPKGLILTPYHVIEGATKIYVHLPGGVGSYADIHAADGRHDLAVLKLINPPTKLTAIKFADVQLRPLDGKQANIFNGKLAILMANPYITGFRIDKPSASLGSITNVRYPTERKGEKNGSSATRSDNYYRYGPLIEHDVNLNAGCDGAALLNLNGELIGLTTSSAIVADSKNGAGYAFPVDENFQRVVDVLRRGGEVEYGFLGVQLNDSDLLIPSLQILAVTPRAPAALAGIRPGDTINAVNDTQIRNYAELLFHVGHALAGNSVKLTVTRAGRLRDYTVHLSKFKHSQFSLASVQPEPVFGLRVDYGTLLAQQPILRVGAGVPAGVCVREIIPNSPAAAAFKKLGDRPERWLITHINGIGVDTPAKFHKEAKGQKSIKLTVLDPGEFNPHEHEVTLP